MRMSYRRLRRRCQAVLDDFDLAAPESLDELCAHLAELRGRPLGLHPLPAGAAEAGACGLWLATGTADHIFFEQHTSRPHQEHIVLHEIGHMLFDHHTLDLGVELLQPDLPGEVDLGLARRMLARTDYTTRQEQEAEMLASLIRTSYAQATESGTARHGRHTEWEAALGLSGDQ